MIVSRLRDLAARRRTRWEGLCLRCGRCCYEKEIRGRAVVTNERRPCRYLDTATMLCSIYETRFSACSACRPMTLFHALFVRWLPESCGYVRHYGGRSIPRRTAEGRHYSGRSIPRRTAEGRHYSGRSWRHYSGRSKAADAGGARHARRAGKEGSTDGHCHA